MENAEVVIPSALSCRDNDEVATLFSFHLNYDEEVAIPPQLTVKKHVEVAITSHSLSPG